MTRLMNIRIEFSNRDEDEVATILKAIYAAVLKKEVVSLSSTTLDREYGRWSEPNILKSAGRINISPDTDFIREKMRQQRGKNKNENENDL